MWIGDVAEEVGGPVDLGRTEFGEDLEMGDGMDLAAILHTI